MGAEVVIRSFPAKLREMLEPLKISHLEEVRLRADQPLMVVWNGKDYFVTDQGNCPRIGASPGRYRRVF